MPGDVVPTAATWSPTPIACSALTACGLTFTAAPISPQAGAVSNTSAFMPQAFSALAGASPASRPPTIAILQLRCSTMIVNQARFALPPRFEPRDAVAVSGRKQAPPARPAEPG